MTPSLHIQKRAPAGPFFVYGGEGEIRTLERLPVTHFPGVRLRPLGHLTLTARIVPQAPVVSSPKSARATDGL